MRETNNKNTLFHFPTMLAKCISLRHSTKARPDQSLSCTQVYYSNIDSSAESKHCGFKCLLCKAEPRHSNLSTMIYTVSIFEDKPAFTTMVPSVHHSEVQWSEEPSIISLPLLEAWWGIPGL